LKTLVAVKSRALVEQVFNGNAYEKLKKIGGVTFVTPEFDGDCLAECVEEYDFCVTGWETPKFTDGIIARAKRLKVIAHTAGTVVPIVNRSVFESGIKVVNANASLAKSTAEFAMTLMLAGAWNINSYSINMKNGIWSDGFKESVLGVGGRIVGLIGCGEISRELIRLLKPFDVKILLYSSYCSQEEAECLGVELTSLDGLLKRSDIVSLHNTLTERSCGMLGKRELSLIRDGGLFVNTARQPIVDNEALISEMRSGRLYGAVDVYETEPVPACHPLFSLPNVVCTPHIGGFAQKWKNGLAELVIDDILRFIYGEPLQNEVTVELFDRQSLN
jgi:phosphoglycerate dehydrogenase-like enzyme